MRLREHCAESPAQRSLSVERLRRREFDRLGPKHTRDQRFVASLNVLMDLTKQGWLIRLNEERIEVARPSNPLDPEQDRLRIRDQLHVERDDQLRQPAVRAFIDAMEKPRVVNGKTVRIYSLMRDGRDLAEQLRRGEQAIRPYLQFVNGEEKCERTGFRLVDIWRYFRHTWSSPYKSVPGRSMMVLVRDESGPFHPVIGIAALSSATVGLSVRDEFIGWTFKKVWQRFVDGPAVKYAKWMQWIVDTAIDEIFKEDLFGDDFNLSHLKKPTPEVIQKLLEEARQHRKAHYRMMQGADYKVTLEPEDTSDEYWESQAKSLLFRGKREQELANLLQIRSSLNTALGSKPMPSTLKQYLESREGKVALSRLIRKAKADRVGTVIADLAICGAVPPYNEVLGGKLVAMLMASPEVVHEYRRRYCKTPSIIASSMAGRAVVRPADLVYISTTSLYGRRPNQYDRISIPVSQIVPGTEGTLRYKYLKKTKGFGTFQFGPETVEAMSMLLAQSKKGQRVNSVFGEGTNPRLRKIRDALDELGLPSNTLLDHGAPRLVYGLTLIHNLSDYLLGIDEKPKYIVPVRQGSAATTAISEWWRERWCQPRVAADGVLDGVEAHTLNVPVKHGARVIKPATIADEPLLFESE